MLFENGKLVYNDAIEKDLLRQLALTCKSHQESNCLNCQLRLTNAVVNAVESRR
jgi:hypothetical protein